MLKVVLIEDEDMVLRGMEMVLRKERDVELAGTAEDGKEGLDLILREKPDVVLTDIRMPEMSGLEMIERAQKGCPNTAYIIFSGFNEFKYVQTAIGLGVLEYLEKPVTVQELQKALKKAKQLVEYKKNYMGIKERANQLNRVMVERVLYDLLNQPSAMEEENMRRLLEAGDRLGFSTEVAVVSVGKVTGETEEADDYRKLINTMVFSAIGEHEIEVFTLTINEHWIFIYFNQECELFPFYDTFTKAKQDLENEEIYFFAGISNIYQSIYDLKTAFNESKSALMYALFLETEEIVKIGDVEYQSMIPIELTDSEYSLSLNFRLQNYQECRNQISAYTDYLRGAKFMPELLRHGCMEFLYALRKLVMESGTVTAAQIPAIKYQELTQMMSADEMIVWTKEKAYAYMEKMEEVQRKKAGNPVAIVRQFIDCHFSESLTLDILADQVHMNPTYLSVAFKKEEGISYSHYLAKVRMERAMELLEKGEKGKDICRQVGYYDFRYFNKQFKKYTGMTPETYKRRRITGQMER